jgi:hypothetical protein
VKIKIPGGDATYVEKQVRLILETMKADGTGDFRIDNDRRVGKYFGFVLRMAQNTPTRKAEREDDHHPAMRYRKLGSDMKRWTGAVCFHGHKAFMDRIFERFPDAVIRTKLAAYLGREDFDKKWVSSGMIPEGPRYMGMQYREFCNCYGG